MADDDDIGGFETEEVRKARPSETGPSQSFARGGILTQTQLADAVAKKAGLSRADARKAIAALEEVVIEQIGKAEKVKIGGIVQIEARYRPPTQEREARNPVTGEVIIISAKPASVAVKARPLAKVKNALPKLGRAASERRRKLAG